MSSTFCSLPLTRLVQFAEASNAKKVATSAGGTTTSAGVYALVQGLPPCIASIISKEASQGFAVTESGLTLPVNAIQQQMTITNDEEQEAAAVKKAQLEKVPKICYEVVRVKNGRLLFHDHHNDRLLQSIAMVLFPSGMAAKAVVNNKNGDHDKSHPFYGVTGSMDDVRDIHSAFFEDIIEKKSETPEKDLQVLVDKLFDDRVLKMVKASPPTSPTATTAAVDGAAGAGRPVLEQNIKIITWVEENDNQIVESCSPRLGFPNKQSPTMETAAAEASPGSPLRQETITTTEAMTTVEKMLTGNGILPSPENNVDGDDDDSSSSSTYRLRSISYYIKSTYPSESWYNPAKSMFEISQVDAHGGGPGGCDMGLLYNAVRHNPNAKALHVSVRDRAVELHRSKSLFESMLVHPDGVVPEGSRSNIFIVKDNALLMSTDAAVLVGCTRMAVNAICEKKNIPIIKKEVTLKEVLQAEAIVMTGTSVGVLPIRRIFLCDDVAREQGSEAVELMMNSLPEGCPEEVKTTLRTGAPPPAEQQTSNIPAEALHNIRLTFRSAEHPIVAEILKTYNEEVYGI